MRHTILLEAFYDGDWHAVPTNNRTEVVITEGQQDQLQRMSPSVMTIEINNRDGTYSPRNPFSPLYGKIGRGTLCRLTVDGEVEFVGRAESWPRQWTPGITDQWVPLTARGITYWLGLPGTRARFRSAMRRFCDPVIAGRVGRIAPRGYWPIDHGEPSAADQAAPAVGSEPLVLEYTTGEATATWSAVELAPWLGRGLQVDGSIRLLGPPPPDATVTEAAASDIVLRNGLPGEDASAVGLRLWEAAEEGGDPFNYLLIGTRSLPGGMNLFLYRENLNTFSIAPFGIATSDQAAKLWDNRLRHLRVMAVQNGSDVDVFGYVDGELVVSGTHSAATLGVPKWQIQMNGQPRAVLGQAILWAGDAADIPPAADVWAAAQGCPGERAHERIERICLEEGIACTIVGDRSDPVGPQPLDTPMSVIDDAAAVDGGVLYEPRDVFGIGYRTRDSLYNLAPVATLTWGQKEIGALNPADDLDLVENDITVTNRNTGASAHAVQETGPLNANNPEDDPQGVGRIEVEYRLNLPDDSDLADHAGWRLRLGTWDEERYPALVVDPDALAAQGKTTLAAALAAALPGQMVRVDTSAARASGLHQEDIDLLIRGMTRRASGARRLIEFNAVPYGPYEVRVWGEDSGPDLHAHLGRWGEPVGTHLEVAVDEDDTTLAVDSGAAGLWVTDPGEFDPDQYTPLLVTVGGERMRVTGISDDGAGLYTFTVERAVNGIAKAHDAGSLLAVYRPLIWAK